MPSGFFHIMAAIAVFALFLSHSADSMVFAAFLLSSLVPDLDSRNSKIRKYASIAAALAPALFVSVTLDAETSSKILSSAITFISFYIIFSRFPTSHRGKKSLHSPMAGIAVSAAFGLLFRFFLGQEFFMVVAASLLGYLTHLAADRLFGK